MLRFILSFSNQNSAISNFRSSLAQRIQNDVDAEGISVGSEFQKVPGIFSFTLPRVVDIGIVRHEDHQPAGLVADAAAVDVDAVCAVLGCAAAGAPHAD